MIVQECTAPPESDVARISLILSGSSIKTALFRSDVKKNLVFFRGCGSTYEELENDLIEIIGEGKTSQLQKFVTWCNDLSSEENLKKSSFQSPKHDVKLVKATWLPFVGNLKGFTTRNEAPALDTATNEVDITAMTGTDESV